MLLLKAYGLQLTLPHAAQQCHQAQITNGFSQRGRHASNIATESADPDIAITHTSTAMDGWSAYRHNSREADSATAASVRNVFVGADAVVRTCCQCALIDRASQAIPRKPLPTANASNSHSTE